MKLGWIILIIFILFFGIAFIFLHVPFNNSYELKQCKLFNDFERVIYEDNFLLDKCIIIEDGEELTIGKYFEKHRYDELEVRK